MSEYFITKRDKCECYYGIKREFLPSDFDENAPHALLPINLSPKQDIADARCTVFGCFNGYIETTVDLLEVLAKVRFTCADENKYGEQFDNLHIEEGE